MDFDKLNDRLGTELKESDFIETEETEDNEDEWVKMTDEKEINHYRNTGKRLISITEEETDFVEMYTVKTSEISVDGEVSVFTETTRYERFTGDLIDNNIYKKKYIKKN